MLARKALMGGVGREICLLLGLTLPESDGHGSGASERELAKLAFGRTHTVLEVLDNSGGGRWVVRATMVTCYDAFDITSPDDHKTRGRGSG